MYRKKKAYTTQVMIAAIVIIILSMFTFASGVKVLNGSADKYLSELTKKTAVNIYNELLLISSVEQGVKYYDVKGDFKIRLTSDNVEVEYTYQSGTTADKDQTSYIYTIPHGLTDIIETEFDTTVDKICISKRIVDCKPEITICIDDGSTTSCCNLDPNQCKMVY